MPQGQFICPEEEKETGTPDDAPRRLGRFLARIKFMSEENGVEFC